MIRNFVCLQLNVSVSTTPHQRPKKRKSIGSTPAAGQQSITRYFTPPKPPNLQAFRTARMVASDDSSDNEEGSRPLSNYSAVSSTDMSDQSAPICSSARLTARRISTLLVPDVASTSSESSGPNTPVPLSRPESLSPQAKLDGITQVLSADDDINSVHTGLVVPTKSETELPPRLKLANAEDSSDIDTDTEIEQLTRGAVNKDDKPPVLSPVGAMELEPVPNAESLPVRPPRLDDGNLVNLGGGQGEAGGDIWCQNSPDLPDIPKPQRSNKKTESSGESKQTRDVKELKERLLGTVSTQDHAEQIEVSADVDLDKTPEMRNGVEGQDVKLHVPVVPKSCETTAEPSIAPPNLNVDAGQISTQPFADGIEKRQLALQTEEAIEDALETIGSSLPSATHQPDSFPSQLAAVSQVSPYQQTVERPVTGDNYDGAPLPTSIPVATVKPRGSQAVVSSPSMVAMNRSFENCTDRNVSVPLESPRSAGSVHRSSVDSCMSAVPPTIPRMVTPQQLPNYQISAMAEPRMREEPICIPAYFQSDNKGVAVATGHGGEPKKRATSKKSKSSAKKQEVPVVPVPPSQYQNGPGGFHERPQPIPTASSLPSYGSGPSYGQQQYGSAAMNVGLATASQMPSVSPYKQPPMPNTYNNPNLYYGTNSNVNPAAVSSAFGNGMMNGAGGYQSQSYASPYSSVSAGTVRPSYTPQMLGTAGYLPPNDANFSSNEQFGNYQAMAAIQTLQMQQAYGAAFNPYNFQQPFNASSSYFQPGSYPGGMNGQTSFNSDPFGSYAGVQANPPRGPAYYGTMGFATHTPAPVHNYPPSNFSLPGRK